MIDFTPSELVAADSELAKLLAGPVPTDADLVQADLEYLTQREQRDARRLAEAHQLDVDAMRRAGL